MVNLWDENKIKEVEEYLTKRLGEIKQEDKEKEQNKIYLNNLKKFKKWLDPKNSVRIGYYWIDEEGTNEKRCIIKDENNKILFDENIDDMVTYIYESKKELVKAIIKNIVWDCGPSDKKMVAKYEKELDIDLEIED